MSTFTAQEVLDEIARQAPGAGISPKLAQAFFITENSDSGTIKPDRKISGATMSPRGARGVMQTMPATEAGLQKAGFLPAEWKFNPADLRGQVQAGLAALQEMQGRQKNRGDVLELAAMYNGGNAAWRAYREGAMEKIPAETQHYFKKISTALGFGGPMDQGTQAQSSQIQQGAPVASSSSSATRTSTRTNVFDPLALDAALQSATQLTQNGGSFDTALQQITAAQVQRQQAEASQIAAITDWSTKQGLATTAQTALDAGEAARRAQILTAASINPVDAGNKANAAMEQIMLAMPSLEAAGAEIDARQAVGIFDNPLQWLVNQVRLPGMVGQYNQQVRSVNRTIEGVKNLQGLAATQITLGQASDADAITNAGAAKAAEQAAAAQAKLTEVQAATAGAAVRDAQTALALQTDKTKVLIDIAQLTKQVQSENVGMSEKDAERRAHEIQLQRVNNWLKMIGSNQRYDTATFKAIPAKTREELLVASSGDGISRTLWDGLSYINQLGDWRKIAAEGDAGAVTWMRNTLMAADKLTAEELKLAEQQARISGKPIAKREVFLEQAVNKMEQLYTAELADMRTANDSNPYKIAYDHMVKVPALQNNAVSQFLKANGPTSQTPIFNKVDEKFIIDHFTGQIAAGKVTSGQAAQQISQFYSGAMKEQAARSKYALFGFSAPEGYKVVIPISGLFEGASRNAGVIDLTNPAAVEQYLIKNTAMSTARTMGYRPFFDPLGLSKPGGGGVIPPAMK